MAARLDELLVTKGLAQTRSQAKDLIKRSLVSVDGNFVTSPGKTFSEECRIEVESIEFFVSRAGSKMQWAIQELDIDVKNKVIFDCGISTGGFTDCLLRKGAKFVVGIDVGHGQLHPSLKQNEKVFSKEKINIKNLTQEIYASWKVPLPDIIVVDVSFISLTHVLPHLKNIFGLKPDLITLVKPQFESDSLTKKYSDEDTLVKILKCSDQLGYSLTGLCQSGLKGQDGTQEYFLRFNVFQEPIPKESYVEVIQKTCMVR